MVLHLSLQQAIDRILAHQARVHPERSATELLSHVHLALCRQLSQVIGRMGFEALLSRTMARIRVRYPQVTGVPNPLGAFGAELGPFWASLAGIDPRAALEIGGALLLTLCELLATFIGEALVLQLLRNAWPDALADAPPSSETR